LQGFGDPRHLAGKGAVRNFGHAHHGVDPGLQSECFVLRREHLGSDDVAVHGCENERWSHRRGFASRHEGPGHRDDALLQVDQNNCGCSRIKD